MIVTCAKCSQQNRVPAGRLTDAAKCGKCKNPIGPIATTLPIESAADFDELVAGGTPVMVDFWAPWCGPCRTVAPEVEKITRAHAGEVVVAKVNTDQLPEVAGRFGIQGIPTLILFRGGREARRVSGAMSARDLEAQLLHG